MAWTYTPMAGTLSDKDYVRTLIGDTDTNDPQFQDELINSFITRNDVLTAALVLCQCLIAFYARRVAISVDGMKIDLQQRVDNYKKNLDAIKLIISSSTGNFGAPLVSGVSMGAMQSVNSNIDRFPSHNLVGMMEAPGVLPAMDNPTTFLQLYFPVVI